MSNLYIYAVIRSEDAREIDLPPVAEPMQKVACHQVGPIAVVVSPTEQTEIMSTRRNMLSHTKILEEIVRDRPVLPFRFGVIATGLARIESILGARARELRGTLDSMADLIEVGVRLTFQEREIFQKIVEAHPDLRRRGESLKRRPKAETYYEQIDLGRAVEEKLSQQRAALGDAISQRLAPFAERAIRHKTFEDMAIYSAALLVRREQEPALFAEVQKIEAEFGDRVAMKYVSPAPPYHFVSIRLDAQAA
ncbi:hypothetical protein CCR94_19260 [Rhodoblastus sphagnicola]|uniref:Gas vesicle protein GvpFL n=1 Tax=Rhodoblastus sphagnicola TaxID=333368 RepID=A0A2S6MZK0_9HYPH|nr:GvpL/GvpF family gas vesicle protein [Rhodoblastus sphagnicola]MBB4200731.1 hypothetical protein [Rhodoblastus sphagnicola]PPQ27805.1 hypothetical protein CCR94_19260 [Rhodoblastus sphagnicola]